MSLYSLAGEVRTHIGEAFASGDEAQRSIWSDRLNDLGLRVADTLVEMGELETATRHLDTLVGVKGDELAYRKALLRLRVGDVTSAQVSVNKIQNPARKVALDALLDIANDDIAAAVEKWQSHSKDNNNNALFASNLAVGLLYTSKLAQAQRILEDLTQNTPTFPGLLFNVGTIYELCTEQALERKTATVSLVASKQPHPVSGGWEKPNFDFKL